MTTAYLLLLLMTTISCTSVALTKKFQVSARPEAENYLQANICAGVLSCVFLFLASGCKPLRLSEATICCALALGFLSTISVFITVYVYSKTSLALALIVSSAGSIVVPILFGLCFNGEQPSIRLIISAVLILVAAILPFAKRGMFKDSGKFLWILILFFFFNGATGIVSKVYAQTEGASDTSSYLILTNVFVIIFSLVCALFILLRKKKALSG